MIYIAVLIISIGVLMLLYAWRKSVEQPGRMLARGGIHYRYRPVLRTASPASHRSAQGGRSGERARSPLRESRQGAGRRQQASRPPPDENSATPTGQRAIDSRPASREIRGRQLSARGILYLDQERRFPYMTKNYSEIPPGQYNDLRRIGRGTITVGQKRFTLHCGEVNYSYSARDLDQILFKPDGLALVPLRFDRPIPLFLTREVDKIKGFIKRHATVRSQ